MAFDQEGTFNAKPIAWGIFESQSSESVAVSIEWIPEEILVEIMDEKTDETTKEFVPFDNKEGNTVSGEIWIIGKTGKILETAVQQTMKDTLGWSGEFSDLEEGGNFKPPSCQITVEKDTYKGVKYKVKWVNPIGGGTQKPKKLSNEVATSLSKKFGNNIKQVMGGQEQTPF